MLQIRAGYDLVLDELREIRTILADELDLGVPDAAWYAARDRLAELLGVFGMIANTLSKAANQVLMLNRPRR